MIARTAVILAAGLGQRLGPLTINRPKAMVELDGRPLLDHTLAALAGVGVTKIWIITGHCHEVIDAWVGSVRSDAVVQTILNRDFADANNIVSFLVAANVLVEGGVLVNGDVVLDPSIVADLIGAPAGSWLVVDDSQALDAEDMKVEVGRRGRMRHISKTLDLAQASGEYIGLARLDQTGARLALDAARRLVDRGERHLYYEDAFDLAAPQIGFRTLSTQRRAWTEIDDQRDYERAVGIARALTAADMHA